MKKLILVLLIVVAIGGIAISQTGEKYAPISGQAVIDTLNYCADWGDCEESVAYVLESHGNFVANCTDRIGAKPLLGTLKNSENWQNITNSSITITKEEACNDFYGGATCIGGDDCDFVWWGERIKVNDQGHHNDLGNLSEVDLTLNCCKMEGGSPVLMKEYPLSSKASGDEGY